MAPPFIFPQNLQALEEEYDDGRLSVQNPTAISSFRPSSLEEFVKGVSFDLSDKELFCVEDQDLFDRVYSLVKDFSNLTPACKFNLVESLRSNFSVLLPNVDSLSRASQSRDDDEPPVHDRIASHRNAFKIYTFFLVHVILAEESNSTSNNTTKVVASSRKKQLINSWNWEPQRGRILNLVANSLEINLSLLFGSSNPDENYLTFIVKYQHCGISFVLALVEPLQSKVVVLYLSCAWLQNHLQGFSVLTYRTLLILVLVVGRKWSLYLLRQLVLLFSSCQERIRKNCCLIVAIGCLVY